MRPWAWDWNCDPLVDLFEGLAVGRGDGGHEVGHGLTIRDRGRSAIRRIAHRRYSSSPLRSASVDAELVGRESAAAVLSGWLDSVRAAGGRVVLVSGEAGIGKSRLVSALAERARAGSRPVLWGRTTEQDGAPPYWPWLQVLEPIGGRALLEAPPGPDPDSERFARFEAVSAALATAAGPSSLVVLEDVQPGRLGVAPPAGPRRGPALGGSRPPGGHLPPEPARSGSRLRGRRGRPGPAAGAPSASSWRAGGGRGGPAPGRRRRPRRGRPRPGHLGGQPPLRRGAGPAPGPGGDLYRVPRSIRDALGVRLASRSDGPASRWCRWGR